jgi:hypothetical protein
LSRANSILATAFDFDPCFRLTSNGGPVTTC